MAMAATPTLPCKLSNNRYTLNSNLTHRESAIAHPYASLIPILTSFSSNPLSHSDYSGPRHWWTEVEQVIDGWRFDAIRRLVSRIVARS
jgi:hypothetical protein